jgi:hypothetical protein
LPLAHVIVLVTVLPDVDDVHFLPPLLPKRVTVMDVDE